MSTILGWRRPGTIERRQHKYSSIAQPVEHATVNRRVVGSSPTWGARSEQIFCSDFLLELGAGDGVFFLGMKQPWPLVKVTPIIIGVLPGDRAAVCSWTGADWEGGEFCPSCRKNRNIFIQNYKTDKLYTTNMRWRSFVLPVEVNLMKNYQHFYSESQITGFCTLIHRRLNVMIANKFWLNWLKYLQYFQQKRKRI